MGYYNGKKVLSVASVEYLTPRGQIKLTENGSYDVQAYKKAVVAVFPSGTIQTIEDEGVAQGAGAFPSTILPKGLINYVGGMSQKVNQHVTNGNFESVSGWETSNTTRTANNNKLTIVCGEENAVYQVYRYIRTKAEHKYLVSAFMTASSNGTIYVRFGSVSTSPYGNLVANQRKNIIGIKTLTSAEVGSTGYTEYNFYALTSSGFVGGDTIIVENATLVDLTEIYGAGNEPTSTSDPRIQWLIGYLKNNPQYNGGSIVNAKVTNLLSTDGTNETNYPIPAEVQALDGYGLGIDDTLYNYIDFERKKFVKKVVSYTFTGNEVWNAYASGYTANITGVSNLVKKASANSEVFSWQINNAGLKATSGNELYTGRDTSGIAVITNGNIFIGRDDYANISNLVGKTIVFELAEPTETDISEYLDRDFPNENLIDLYADGKVYFENENYMGVPYSLTYQERIN